MVAQERTHDRDQTSARQRPKKQNTTPVYPLIDALGVGQPAQFLDPQAVLSLQRMVGNQTVCQLLNKKGQTLQRTLDKPGSRPRLAQGPLPQRIQRVSVQSTTVDPITTVSYQLRIVIRCRLDNGTQEVFTVTISEGKHLLASYRETEVTTGNSGINTNTIATVDRTTFRAAFTEWGAECARQLQSQGTTWVPLNHSFTTTQGLTFSSDSSGGTHTIHSFPTGTTRACILTDAQYDLLKRIASAYYGFGNYRSAANDVMSVLTKGTKVDDVAAVLTLLNITTGDLTHRIQAILETQQYERDEIRWMNSFIRNISPF